VGAEFRNEYRVSGSHQQIREPGRGSAASSRLYYPGRSYCARLTTENCHPAGVLHRLPCPRFFMLSSASFALPSTLKSITPSSNQGSGPRPRPRPRSSREQFRAGLRGSFRYWSRALLFRGFEGGALVPCTPTATIDRANAAAASMENGFSSHPHRG